MDDVLKDTHERLEARGSEWIVATDGEVLDINARSGEPRIRRCTLKLYETGGGKVCAFFYKRSLLPYSRNRYSYGHVTVKRERIDDSVLEGWLEFVASGFHPDRRPPRLHRAAPTTIPD